MLANAELVIATCIITYVAILFIKNLDKILPKPQKE